MSKQPIQDTMTYEERVRHYNLPHPTPTSDRNGCPFLYPPATLEKIIRFRKNTHANEEQSKLNRNAAEAALTLRVEVLPTVLHKAITDWHAQQEK